MANIFSPLFPQTSRQEAWRDINAFLHKLKSASNRNFEVEFNAGIRKCLAAAQILGEPLAEIVEKNKLFTRHFSRKKKIWFKSLCNKIVDGRFHDELLQEARKGSRDVWFTSDASTETAIWDRNTLPAGSILSGPAIVEQLDSTIVVPDGWIAHVDGYMNLILTREA